MHLPSGLLRVARALRPRDPRSAQPPTAQERASLAGRLSRLLPMLALAVLVIAPAVAAGALAMRTGDPEPEAPVAAGLPAVGPSGASGASGATGPVAVAPVAGPTGATAAAGPAAPRAGADYYRRTTTRTVAASAERGFLPLYREAARAFGVDWRLIASVHRQETAFSSEPSTYRGLNAFGCCAGPMQFNVTNGPVSTWELYRNAYRRGTRPAAYPHPTRTHPSVYDDFDAIMAAAALLRDGGARGALDGGSWLAAYGYYGRDEFGVTYASQVLARAQAWRRDGFSVNGGEDPALVAALEDAYGVFERQKLRAATGEDDEAKAERRRERRRLARERRAAAAKAERVRRARPAPEAPRRSEPPPSPQKKPAAKPTPKPSEATAPTPTPPASTAPAATAPAETPPAPTDPPCLPVGCG